MNSPVELVLIVLISVPSLKSVTVAPCKPTPPDLIFPVIVPTLEVLSPRVRSTLLALPLRISTNLNSPSI